MLSDDDREALARRNHVFDVIDVAGWAHVTIHEYKLPEGFQPAVTNLLIKLPPGFPDAAPDMFWTLPHVTLTRTAAAPPNADQLEPQSDGQVWQRFSRHLQTPWRPGIDDLDSWLATIEWSLQRDSSA